MKKLFLLALLFLIPMFSNAADCNGFRPFHGGLASQGAHAKASCTCDSCHTPGIYTAGSAPRTCVGCHMGQKSTARQKTPSHIQTGSIGCENCHSANDLSFDSGRMNHIAVAGQACTSCHGVSARGKPSDHIPTSEACDVCHKPSSSWDAKMNHTGITSGCASCHKQSANHVATGMECTVCHNTSNFTSWSCGGQ